MRQAGAVFGVVAAAMLLGGCSDPGSAVMTAAVRRYQLESIPQLAGAPRASETLLAARTDAVDEGVTWLAAGEALARDAERYAKEEAAERPFVPWRERRGPAYPGDLWHSFGRDAKEFAPMMWDDTKATATNPVSLVLLGAAGVTGIALSGRANDRVEEHFKRHGSGLNTFWDTVGDVGGNPGTHFAVAGAMYFTGLARDDTKTYEVSKTMLSALAINGLATMGLKAMARTESPNGDEFGWPSGHTSSTFCFATVMHEEYGPWVGVPLFAFAGFVGYERIDARNHDFSDVISGALIGIAIGHAVAKNHEMKIFGMDVVPYTDPRGTVGIALSRQW